MFSKKLKFIISVTAFMSVVSAMFVNCSKISSGQSDNSTVNEGQGIGFLSASRQIASYDSQSTVSNANQTVCEGKSVKVIDVATDNVFTYTNNPYGKLQLFGDEMIFYRVKTPSVKSGTGKQWSFIAQSKRPSGEGEAGLNPDFTVAVSTNFCDFSKSMKARVLKTANSHEILTSIEVGYLIRQSPSVEDKIFGGNTLLPDQVYLIQVKPNTQKAVEINYSSYLYGLYETPVHNVVGGDNPVQPNPQISPDNSLGQDNKICEGRKVKVLDVTTESVFATNTNPQGNIQFSGDQMIFYRFKTPSVKSGTGKQWYLSVFSKRPADTIELSPEYEVAISTQFCDFGKTLPLDVRKYKDLTDSGDYISTQLTVSHLIRQNPSTEDKLFNGNTLLPDQFYYIQIKTNKSSYNSLLKYYSYLYGLYETPVHNAK